METGGDAQPGGRAEFAVWGGLVRTDTYYAPTNFSLHFHVEGAEAFIDDAFGTCGAPGSALLDGHEEFRKVTRSIIEAGWSVLLDGD